MTNRRSNGLLSMFLQRKRIAAAQPYLYGSVLDMGCGKGELAEYIRPKEYLGIDIRNDSIIIARRSYPEHRFETTVPTIKRKFDTITLLAVIEHIEDPAGFLRGLRPWLKESPNSRIVLTTHHPNATLIYAVGARVGLFSATANRAHKMLLDRPALYRIGQRAGYSVLFYRRFLLRAN